MALVKYICQGVHCISAKHGITMFPGMQLGWVVSRKPGGRLVEEVGEVDYDAACVTAQMMLERAQKELR